MNSPIKILVVDDEPLIIETLEAVLQCYGYAVAGADSGYRALNAVCAEHYHVALVDIMMPEMNGVELMTEMRRLSADTKIILMTAYDKDHPLVKQAIAEKPDKLLQKPLDPTKLVSIINYYEKLFKCIETPCNE